MCCVCREKDCMRGAAAHPPYHANLSQEEGKAQFKLKFGVREGLPVSHAPQAVFQEDQGK